MNREIERLENAIRHINSSLDVDEWAKTEAVAAMRYRIGMLTGRKNEQAWEWVETVDIDGIPADAWKCGCCGEIYAEKTKCCPNCGAQMKDGEER